MELNLEAAKLNRLMVLRAIYQGQVLNTEWEARGGTPFYRKMLSSAGVDVTHQDVLRSLGLLQEPEPASQPVELEEVFF